MTPNTEPAYAVEQLTYNHEIEPVYLIDPSRFLWLSLGTFGIYTLLWCYKTYRFFHEKDGVGGNALLKTVFNFLFLLSLFKCIVRFAKEKGYKSNFKPLTWYGLVVIPGLCSFLPLPFFFLFGLISYVLFIPPLRAFNYAVSQSIEIRAYTQTRLRRAQTVVVIVGVGLWVTLLIYTLLKMGH